MGGGPATRTGARRAMRDILSHPNWSRAADAEYARWHQAQPVDPATLYRDPRVAFALEVGLIVSTEASDYLPGLSVEFLRGEGVPPPTLA